MISASLSSSIQLTDLKYQDLPSSKALTPGILLILMDKYEMLEQNSAPFSMLGGMLDLSRMFRIAGDNWVTLEAKLQDQQPKGKLVSAAAWAQLRGSRTAAGTVLLFHTQEPEIFQAGRS